jgi:hypothetical protein
MDSCEHLANVYRQLEPINYEAYGTKTQTEFIAEPAQ